MPESYACRHFVHILWIVWNAMNWYCFDCYLWLLQRQDHVEMEDLTVSRESLEVLTVCLMLCPPALEALNKDKSWQTFIKDLLLHCKNRYPWKKSINVFFCMYLRSTIWILILGKFYPILFLPTLPQFLVVKKGEIFRKKKKKKEEN